jgi:hypothetical protein
MQAENPFKGPSSYEDGDKFYGREIEIKELSSLIKNELLTLLFSRSGTGKSSLIKAGLFPYLKIDFEFFPIYIHLNDAAVKASSAHTLCDFVIKRCEEEIEKQFDGKENFKINVSANRKSDSLFEFIHNTEIIETDSDSSTEYKIKPVLFFDQLEEIFTNPFHKKELQFLLHEIRCLVENEVPEYLREEMISENDQYNKIRSALKNKQKNFRVFFSFREEYLPQFESLRREIPSIRFTNSRYRLEPFTIDTATDIIIKTAALIPVSVARAMAENISTTVEGFDEKRVDPFLMSLICQIIYVDISGDIKTTGTVDNERIKSLVDNALESYVSKVYNSIGDETKKFVEYRLITSDGKKNSVNFNEVETNAVLCSEILTLVNNPDTRLLSIGQFLDSKHLTILHDRLLPPLIKRKVERKAKEENDALAAKQAALEQDNKRKQRKLILSFIAGALVLSIWLYANIQKRNEIKELLFKNNINQLKADSAIAEAVRQKEKARMITEEAYQLKMEADSATDEATYMKGIVVLQNKEAEFKLDQLKITEQKAEYYRDLVNRNEVDRDLKNERIDVQSLGDSLIFNNVYKQLLHLKKIDAFQKYDDLISNLRTAVDQKEIVFDEENSFKGFLKAKEILKEYKDIPYVDSILLHSFFNKTIFYKQIITLPDNDSVNLNFNKTIITFAEAKKSDDSQNFAYNIGNKIYAANFNFRADSVAITPVGSFILKDVNSFNSLAYANNEIIAYLNNSLSSYKIGKSNDSNVTTKLITSSNSKGILSPNGKYLITFSDYDSVTLWRLDGLQTVEKKVLNMKSGDIKSIIFSYNSGRVLLLGSNGDLKVYITDSISDNNTLLPPIISYGKIRAANFSPDGINLMMLWEDKIYMQTTLADSSGKYGRAIKKLELSYDVIDNIDPVNLISMSPDFKKILLETSRDLIVIIPNDADAVLISSLYLSSNELGYKKFQNDNFTKAAAFLDASSIITVDETGKVYLCKIYPSFKTLDEAFTTIKSPPLTPLEQLGFNSTDAIYNQLIASNSLKILTGAAEIYWNRFYGRKDNVDYTQDTLDLFRAKELYSKAIKFPGSDTTDIPEKLILIYQELIRQEPTLQNFKNNAAYNLALVQLAEKYNYYAGRDKDLSTHYGNLSFYSFFINNYKDALNYVNRAITLDSTNDFIYTNLALAYLLNKKFDDAERIYNYYKDRTYRTGVTKFSDSFKQDLNDLENFGIIDKNDLMLYEEVKKIRTTILNNVKK